MELRPWHERLQEALLRQRLPRAEVERLAEELFGHAADLIAEGQSMDAPQPDLDARLGTPAALATTARQQFQQRTFAGRHPLLIFLGGPFVALVGSFLALAMLVTGVALGFDFVSGGALEAIDADGAPPAAWEIAVIHSLNTIVRFVPFAVSAWCFVWLGRRSGHATLSVVSCGIITVVALFFSAVVSTTADGHGTWILGLATKVGLDQFLQAIMPIALGAGMLWKSTLRPLAPA
ncbi:MAG: hypothetical protein SH850_25485 [Planctomycetaceae bacterium]|nr:hypothetical protein [Planctomycetaceae bacterium]